MMTHEARAVGTQLHGRAARIGHEEIQAYY